MGDAAEMLLEPELTLQGLLSFMVPNNWPSYDVVANRGLHRISVKARTFAQKSANFVGYNDDDNFDLFAIVTLRRHLRNTSQFHSAQRSCTAASDLAKPRNGHGFFVHRIPT